MRTANTKVAFAIAAHPDDIEFYMAGTLLLLKEQGWRIHYMTLSSGSCGSTRHNAATVRKIRRKESKAAAKLLGAEYHPSIADDLEIFYELRLLRNSPRRCAKFSRASCLRIRRSITWKITRTHADWL